MITKSLRGRRCPRGKSRSVESKSLLPVLVLMVGLILPAAMAARPAQAADLNWVYSGGPGSPGSQPQYIGSLAYDSTHNLLYAGTAGGVWVYDGSSWTDTGGGLSTYRIDALAYDSSHNLLYAGAYDHGVWVYDGSSWTDTGGGLSTYEIHSLAYDSIHNLLYAGTHVHGVWVYNGSSWTDTGGGVSADHIDSLAYDSSHNLLYAGTGYNGVWVYDGSSWTNTNGGVSTYWITSLAHDSAHNRLYAGTRYYHEGVWVYDGSSWTGTGELSTTAIEYSLAYDSSLNLLYAGTAANGVWVYDGSSWTNTNGGVSTYLIGSLLYDPVHNTLYAGTWGHGMWYVGTVNGPTPVITSLSPPSGLVGTEVTINGANFGATQGSSDVKFNGTSATSCNSWSDTEIKCLVPTGATTGPVTVTTAAGTSNGLTFTVTTVPLPAITTLEPNSGPEGTEVTIDGANFGASRGTSVVQFNGLSATSYSSWSDTQVKCLVPIGATSGPVTVTTSAGTSNGVGFTVTLPLPAIDSVTPNSGPEGLKVTIDGTNFGADQGSSVVKFNGTSATSCTSWSDTEIECNVPRGATTGPVTVTTSAGTSNGVNFKVTFPPTITCLTPASGPVGTEVVITGTRFGASQGSSAVQFNGLSATVYNSWSDTQIRCKVPSGATTGLVAVMTSEGSSNGVLFTLTTVPPLNPLAHGYQWHTFYGATDPNQNDGGSSIATDSSGNIYITGSSTGSWNGPSDQAPRNPHSGNYADLFVMKLSSSGAYQWHTFYGGASNDYGNGIAVDGNGYVYVTGYSGAGWFGPNNEVPLNLYDSGTEIFVLKLDTDGTYQWHTFYGSGSYAYAVALDNHSNVYVGGVGGGWKGPSNENPITDAGGHVPIFVLKLDKDGGYLWHTFYGYDYNEVNGIAVDGCGNVFVTGGSDGPWDGPGPSAPLNPWKGDCCWGPWRNIFVLKLNTEGIYRWHTFYATANKNNAGRGIGVDGSGNVYVAGQSWVPWTGPAGEGALNPFSGTPGDGYRIFALKLDTDGAYRWHTFYGTNGEAAAVTVRGGNLYITGHSASFAQWYGPSGQHPLYTYTGGIFVLKLDTSGSYGWHTFFGQNGDDSAGGIAADDRGGVYLTGSSFGSWNGPSGQTPLHAYTGSWDIFVLKLSLGTIHVSKDGLCNGHSPCYTNIQDGIAAASAPSLIMITQETYNEDIILDVDEEIILEGGWDVGFTSDSFYTTVKGSIRITHGRIIFNHMIIK
jgi:hypothetical protein